DSEFFKLAWHKRARPNQRHARAEFKQPEDVGARDATEENVANDRDVQASDFSSTFADRVQIEEGLRGMFMRTVAGIYYARFESICQELRRARGTVAQHENIGVQCLQIARGVLERLAFGQTGCGRRDIDHVRAQSESSQLE